MREVTPYKTLHGLETAIDNGGRFYNLFSDANDRVVTVGDTYLRPLTRRGRRRDG